MRGTLLYSLLELAHATSQNLEFAHRDDVNVSYGEETITETNLLELRRRHPTIIHLSTFGKKEEARNGADWEWHIIGRGRMLRMRVQAKRLQKDDKLKIPHKVASSSKQQIDLLISDAQACGLKPIYCLYASELQRSIWKKQPPSGKSEEFEYGCLLTSAHKVKAKMPKTLPEIEADSVPWHYLVERQRYSEQKLAAAFDDTTFRFWSADVTRPVLAASDDVGAPLDDFPTLDELNAPDAPERELEGVAEADSVDYRRRTSEGEYRERGISRLLEIDVSEVSPRHPPES